jgi:hypothetical protein
MLRRGLLLCLLILIFDYVPSSSRAQTPAAPVDRAAMTALLDKHCARCHQLEKTTGKYKDHPAANFGFILDLDKLQKDGKYIKAGNAENSLIYQKIFQGEMPRDTDNSCFTADKKPDAYCGPTDAETAAIASYINALPAAPLVASGEPAKPAAAPKRAFVSDGEVFQAVAADIGQVSEVRRRNIRYFTLTHLWNAGDGDDDFDLYRLALQKLVNSLSQRPDIVTLKPVDTNKTVLRVDISDLGWDENSWNKVISIDPYAVFYRDAAFRSVQTETGTPVPMVRGDWFAFTASRPPLYYDLLGLPDNKFDLEKKLGINGVDDIRKLKVARAGFQHSGVSANNRLLERHTISTGAYWESYDFGSNEERKSFFLFPLGPPDALPKLSDQFGFQQDGGEVIFALPNGFHAYYLTDSKGKQLAKGPTNIVQDTSQRDLAVTNGISCMGCHTGGIKFNDKRPDAEKNLDQVRDLVLKSATFPTEVKDVVREIYPPTADFYELMLNDAKQYEAALAKAGITKKMNLGGVEIVNGLSKRFEADLTPALAAAEVGMKPADFLEALNAAGNEFYDLKQRLGQDLVPRDQFVKLYGKLVAKITDNKSVDFAQVLAQINDYQGGSARPVLEVSGKPDTTKTFDLQFFAEQSVLAQGQLGRFKIRSEQPCYLTLINTDSQDRRQILFPNPFATDNRIEANVTIEIPGLQIKGFEFRAGEIGNERVTAICSTNFPTLVEQDFKSGKFKVFENNAQFVGAVRNNRLLIASGTNPAPSQSAPAGGNAVVDTLAQKTIVLKVVKK